MSRSFRWPVMAIVATGAAVTTYKSLDRRYAVSAELDDEAKLGLHCQPSSGAASSTVAVAQHLSSMSSVAAAAAAAAGRPKTVKVTKVAEALPRTKGSHHREDGKGFVNPWESYQDKGFWDAIGMLIKKGPPLAKAPEEAERVPVVPPDNAAIHAFLTTGVLPKPSNLRPTPTSAAPPAHAPRTWSGYFSSFFTSAAPTTPTTASLAPSTPVPPPTHHHRSSTGRTHAASMVATWLGHACVMVTSPGVNVLFDPCWSDRCSPTQLLGPKRLRPPPCALEELPEVDVVVISHNHYDHLDVDTVKRLAGLAPPPQPAAGQEAGSVSPHRDVWFFVPLGNAAWFKDIGVRNVVECDWWDAYEIEVERPGGVPGKATIVCTPAQHFSSRTLWDRNRTLWSSWALTTKDKSFWFGGDTGYRFVPEGCPDDQIDSLPRCPAFKEIGEKLGPFDLSAIPIGAYDPRDFMSSIHLNPQDAVEVHMDIKSKRSLGMHWGTFILTAEPVMEPPMKLIEALKRKGLDLECFITVDIGQSVVVEQGQ
ncbi:hypothetical protein HDU96_008693 [Phlyctochytrium bullatum]|nr:hypothetical protein HDU96_008693 [Phlyctochytrium bullatum]